MIKIQITFTIPDAIKDRVINAFAKRYAYQETITNSDGTTSPNPQTKAQFAKQVITDLLIDSIIVAEVNPAVEATRQAAIDKIKTEIKIS